MPRLGRIAPSRTGGRRAPARSLAALGRAHSQLDIPAIGASPAAAVRCAPDERPLLALGVVTAPAAFTRRAWIRSSLELLLPERERCAVSLRFVLGSRVEVWR